MSKVCLCYRPNPQVGPMIENWDVFLMDRAVVDDPKALDPSVQQILPYVTIFRKIDREVNGQTSESLELLSYFRGGKTTEARLVAKRSVGFGGHIDRLPGEEESILQLIFEETRRELVEEIGFKVNARKLHAAVIAAARSFNFIAVKDAEPVDSVHTALGIMLDISEHPGNDNLVLEAGHIEDARWINIEDITLEELDGYETWSKIVVAGMQRNLGEYRQAVARHKAHVEEQIANVKKVEMIDAINLKAEESEDKAVLIELSPLETGEKIDYEYDATMFRLEEVEGGIKVHAVGDYVGQAVFGFELGGMQHGFLFNIVPWSDEEPLRRRAILTNTMSAPSPVPQQASESADVAEAIEQLREGQTEDGVQAQIDSAAPRVH